MTWGDLLALFFLLVCLAVSAFATAAKTAFFSLSTAELVEMEENGDAKDSRIASLLSQPDTLKATLLLIDNMANTCVAVLGVVVGLHLLPDCCPQWLATLCLFLVLTLLILLVGEIAPAACACKNAAKTARRTAAAVMAGKKLFYGFSQAAARSLTPANHDEEENNDTETAASEIEPSEVDEEKELMRGVLRLGDKTAQEVMTARVDLTDVDIHTDFRTLFRLFLDSGYSRIPVYDGTPDNIKGIIYVKDLLPYLSRKSDFDWTKLVRPAYFVPETKTIDELLREFRRQKIHMAVVVDEFGGTSGIVTLEDVLEEIVGEISDEYDEEEPLYIRVNNSQFIFQGKTPLEDFFEAVEASPSEFKIDDEVETLAGLILSIKDEFPKSKEKFRYGRFAFQILKIDKYRIERVKVTIEAPEAADEKKA